MVLEATQLIQPTQNQIQRMSSQYMIFFGVRQESNDNIRVNRYQHTIATTTATDTNNVPGYNQSRTASNISNSTSTTTTDADPAPKLENSNAILLYYPPEADPSCKHLFGPSF